MDEGPLMLKQKNKNLKLCLMLQSYDMVMPTYGKLKNIFSQNQQF